MGWFRKESRRPRPVYAASNGRGIACFDFGIALLPEKDFSSALLASALEWFWTSTDENPRPTATLPEKRPLTHFSEISRSAFLDDLCDDRGGDAPSPWLDSYQVRRLLSRLNLNLVTHSKSLPCRVVGQCRRFIVEKTM